jgi:hypothetical protein
MPTPRIITLTSHAPVRVYEKDWPIVAKAQGNSGEGLDCNRYHQALAQHELDRYTLILRKHDDGRAICYAVLQGATDFTGNLDCRGGELLDPGSDFVAAIRRVGESCNIPSRIIQECIASLPGEEI